MNDIQIQQTTKLEDGIWREMKVSNDDICIQPKFVRVNEVFIHLRALPSTIPKLLTFHLYYFKFSFEWLRSWIDIDVLSRIKFVSRNAPHPINLINKHLSQIHVLLHLFLSTNWFQTAGGIVAFGICTFSILFIFSFHFNSDPIKLLFADWH